MGNKIPVGRVIEQTFGLSFGRYFTLLGIVWLPMVLTMAVLWLAMIPAMQAFGDMVRQQAQHPQGPMPGQMPDFRLFALAEFLTLFAYIWMGTGVAKEAMGNRTGSRFFYLPGRDELRVAVSLVATFLAVYAALIAVMIVVGGIALIAYFALGGSGATVNPMMAGYASVPLVALLAATEIAFFYVMIRMMHLVVPVTIDEKRITVTRSWALMRGNVLRAILIAVVTILPLLVLEVVAGLALVVPLITQLAALPPGAQPSPALFDNFGQDVLRYLPVYGLIGLALAPVAAGLVASPAAFAYRALVPKKEPAPVS